MASPAAKSHGFQNSFAQAYAGILSATSTWNKDLEELKVETTKMMNEAMKSQEVKTILFNSIDQLNDTSLDERKTKQVLKSIYSSLPENLTGGEFQVMQILKKPIPEIVQGLKEKTETVFSQTTVRKPSFTSSMSSKNMQIIASLAAGQEKRGEEASETMQKIQKTLHLQNPLAASFVKETFGEIKFKVSAPIHQKAIENVERLANAVNQLNQASTTSLKYQELQKILNEARGSMQSAQDIILDLSNYDDLSAASLKKRVQELKDSLGRMVDLLSEKMDVLIASDKCASATQELYTKDGPEAESERLQFDQTIDLYTQTSSNAIALVKVEEEIKTAEKLLENAANQDTPDLIETQKMIATSNKALEQTSKALGVFTEIKAVCSKFTNPLLEKLKGAQKKLTEQTKKVVDNPELKKAIEATNNPQIKSIIEEEVVKLEEVKIQSTNAVENLEKPSAVEFTEKQSKLIALVNTTIKEESQLETRLQKDISALAQRAIPLMRITEAGLLSDADSFSVTLMMVDYINILNYIYDKLDLALTTSKEECNQINDALRKDGIHDLAEFMSIEYSREFNALRPEIEKRIGTSLMEKFDEHLRICTNKHKNLEIKRNS